MIATPNRRLDEAYSDGVKDGKNGDLLDDICHSFGKILSFTKEDEVYNKGYDYGAEHRYEGSSNDSDSGSEDKGGCYLTTACVAAMGLTDRCYELDVLRSFRDNVLLRTPRGRKAVKEYYNLAPEIITAIEEKEGPNAINVFQGLYPEIQKIVNFILSGNFESAFQNYKQMTSQLKTNYL